MNVVTALKRLLQRGDIRNMGEDAQFDLGIVERHERLARLSHESLTDTAAFLRADRNVLQVRIG